MSEELKPCPSGLRINHEPYLVLWQKQDFMNANLITPAAQVKCTCGFSGPERYGDSRKKEAIEAWNTRPEPEGKDVRWPEKEYCLEHGKNVVYADCIYCQSNYYANKRIDSCIQAWKDAGKPTAGVSVEEIDAIVKDSQNCQFCDDRGWYVVHDSMGDIEQEQCRFCYTHPKSKFNLAERIVNYLKGRE